MMTPPKILIVDDRVQNLLVLERLLASLDVGVFKATSGSEALGLVLEHEFCLAIVDVQMPGMDGYELVELMRGNERSTSLPVIFVSAIYSDEYHHRKGYSAGAVDFMSKPFSPDILLSKVKVFIDLYRQQQNLHALLEKLDQANLQIGVVNRDLEQFAQQIAMELRAPVRAIEGYTRILVNDYSPILPDDGQACLLHVHSSAKKLGQMISELLEYAHLGIVPLQCQQVLMTNLARDVFDELIAKAPQLNMDFILADLPDAHGDHAMIKQVFSILFSNALKFSQQSSIRQIEVGFFEQDQRVVFFVRDHGIGFDMQIANDRLFEIFQRLHLDAAYAGIGLGLAKARRIINRHDGRIWAEAEPGKGATFYFTIKGN